MNEARFSVLNDDGTKSTELFDETTWQKTGGTEEFKTNIMAQMPIMEKRVSLFSQIVHGIRMIFNFVERK